MSAFRPICCFVVVNLNDFRWDFKSQKQLKKKWDYFHCSINQTLVLVFPDLGSQQTVLQWSPRHGQHVRDRSGPEGHWEGDQRCLCSLWYMRAQTHKGAFKWGPECDVVCFCIQVLRWIPDICLWWQTTCVSKVFISLWIAMPSDPTRLLCSRWRLRPATSSSSRPPCWVRNHKDSSVSATMQACQFVYLLQILSKLNDPFFFQKCSRWCFNHDYAHLAKIRAYVFWNIVFAEQQ